jgi:chromosome segregation and condensation protein ScpB
MTNLRYIMGNVAKATGKVAASELKRRVEDVKYNLTPKEQAEFINWLGNNTDATFLEVAQVEKVIACRATNEKITVWLEQYLERCRRVRSSAETAAVVAYGQSVGACVGTEGGNG